MPSLITPASLHMLYQVPRLSQHLILHVQVVTCLELAVEGCALEFITSMGPNVSNIGYWVIESIDWGLPIFAETVYHPVHKLASLILLSLTELFNSIITTCNNTSLPGRHGRRMLRISVFSVCYLICAFLLSYMLCFLVLLQAKNFSSLSFEVLDGGSSFGCKRLRDECCLRRW